MKSVLTKPTEPTIIDPAAAGDATVAEGKPQKRKGDRISERPGPPQRAEFVLYLVLNADDRDAIIGDLLEDYSERVLPRFGQRKADFWYTTQVLKSLIPLLWKRLRQIGKWAVIADLVQRVLAKW